jgi:hypothetical protein
MMRARQIANRRDVLDDADLIVDGHHRYDDRVGPQRHERVEIQQSVRLQSG